MRANAQCNRYGWRFLLWALGGLLIGVSIASQSHAQTLNISVVGPGGAAVTNFRWQVEEDTTKPVTLGAPAVPGVNLSLSFHSSYAPVVANGDQSDTSVALDSGKRYFVSVLPDSGYTMGGAPVAAGQGSVQVHVNATPLPTAQISVFVFNDNQPINNAPDLPQELGLEGFTILLTEAGGRYGHNGGQVTQDAFGNPLGIIKTGPNGVALIRNLPPGKYGVQVTPPPGSDWHQTSTIEGTKTIDAWVKANEPPFFLEFGPPGHHTNFGFVRTINDATVLTGGGSISGRVVNLHTSRPPDYAFYDGHPMPNCWVGLNELQAAGGRGVYTAPCDADSSFSIAGVPPDNYQLVVWDEYLDIIIANANVTVPPGGADVDLGDVAVFNWFSRIESYVYFDSDGNGRRDPGEAGIPEQNVNLRFRDGSIYQSFPTDTQGFVPFDEVFPFFNWLVAEVDFLRFKATSVTVVVDDGGPVPPDDGWNMPSRDKLNPQAQSENGGLPYRTETGPVLTQAFQSFLGQTNIIEWGKALYGPGENGGITGVMYYATTRAEDDPRYAAAETWEPGVPRAQVNLYRDFKNELGASIPDGIIDDADGVPDGDGVVVLADIDNYPFGWRDGGAKGDEDFDQNSNGDFDMGDAIAVTNTDSWDDNLPSGCQGDVYVTPTGDPTDCYDGLRNFNQIRPGVFDGGYAFGSPLGDPDLAPGTYIVEGIAPPGYQHIKEEDRNVDFGDDYTPSPLALPPPCVGDPHPVPAVLSLFPSQAVPASFADQNRPLCDRKQVVVAQAKNVAADFFVFTEVPIAAHVTGFVLDDVSNEFDANAPTFGEKYAPPFLPVSIRDWTGREISHVYTDQWGLYNAMLPSTYSVNLPMPSGVSPNMLTTCINSPTMVNAQGQTVPDPNFNRQYSQFCYTFQYMPGTTTYLDTPVLPVAAFAGPNQFPVDCELPNTTPVIYSVSRVGATDGPWVPVPSGTNSNNWPLISIVSVGGVQVPNPAYDGSPGSPRTIPRDYGFGSSQGTVMIGNRTLQVTNWTNGTITARVPPLTTTGQLRVTRAGSNGKRSLMGVTVTVGGGQPIRVQPGASIQAAIDAAAAGALILVPPGTYEEPVIMHKKVRLQGWGAPSTVINPVKSPAEKLQAWRDKINTLFTGGQFDLLPGQETGFNLPNNAPLLFGTEEAPGVMVVANIGEFSSTPAAQRPRIDGFTFTGSDHAGAIMVSGYTNFLEISNNRVFSNNGTFGGGIRIGHPLLVNNGVYVDNQNDNVRIHHNHIMQNGGLDGAGGGVTLCTGADSYQVTENWICGNFTLGDGGGIGHLGRSNNGRIANNTVIFNQTFNQGQGVNGGGIFIGGLPPLGGVGLTPGSGSVDVLANLIQGNQAGAGDGGGIRTQFVNGQDVQNAPNSSEQWYRITIYNNMIAKNVAGLAGGGVSLQDTARVDMIHNTIANNDSTATAGAAFTPGNPNASTAQPAGLVSRGHSTALFNAIGPNVAARFRPDFSNPLLRNNVFWHNRSFLWQINDQTDPATFGLEPAAQPYADLAVLGAASSTARLDPRFCIITSTTGYHSSNRGNNPQVVAEYFNGDRGQTIVMPEFTSTMQTAAAFDEGGNFIDVRFGPLTLWIPGTNPAVLYGDYHIRNNSPAEQAGQTQGGALLQVDFDGNQRPTPANTRPDIGADERQ